MLVEQGFALAILNADFIHNPPANGAGAFPAIDEADGKSIGKTFRNREHQFGTLFGHILYDAVQCLHPIIVNDPARLERANAGCFAIVRLRTR